MTKILHAGVSNSLRLILLIALLINTAWAQDATSPTTKDETSARTLVRLDSLSARLNELTVNRIEFLESRGGSVSALSDDDKILLQEMDAEIEQLSDAFELIALGDVDVGSFSSAETDSPFNWQQELTEVAAPIVDSIKNVTEKPRQLSKLRDAVSKNRRQLQIADQAIATIDRQTKLPLTEPTQKKLLAIRSEWESLRQSVEDQLVTTRIDTFASRHCRVCCLARDASHLVVCD